MIWCRGGVECRLPVMADVQEKGVEHMIAAASMVQAVRARAQRRGAGPARDGEGFLHFLAVLPCPIFSFSMKETRC
ncbi:hypothetical protein SLE2022_210710 [Rubroshorea leprosula]